MKLIISYQNGRTEMLPIAAVENIGTSGDNVLISLVDDNFIVIEYKDIRSIVIA